MKKYDVIIVGAGPAGLRCAEVLGGGNLSVLLLEKNSEPGHKVCAGGITRKGMLMLDIPDGLIQQKISSFTLHSPHYQHSRQWPEPIMVTVNRLEFGKWQLRRITGSNVTFRNNAKVTRINSSSLVINDSEEIGFRYLVGADGPTSIVRKKLGLPVEKVLASVQYLIPREKVQPHMEIFLDSRKFHSWYAWIFPHRDHIAVGTCGNANWISGSTMKRNFSRWLEEHKFDISDATYQSYPISYDYRGLQFGNIFLAGEAAGMASGLTGEGIYQSMLSGEIVARMLTGSTEPKETLSSLLRYNGFQHNHLRISQMAGPFRNVINDLIILVMKNRMINKKITDSFS